MENYIFINIFYCILTCLTIFMCSLQLHHYCENRRKTEFDEETHNEYSLI